MPINWQAYATTAEPIELAAAELVSSDADELSSEEELSSVEEDVSVLVEAEDELLCDSVLVVLEDDV